ncbi:MAG: hypothetical protein GWP66_02710 [Gammaproteobacteria bacterium]|nr:hypothetical protein [Gammaproteobacteria bacterium]
MHAAGTRHLAQERSHLGFVERLDLPAVEEVVHAGRKLEQVEARRVLTVFTLGVAFGPTTRVLDVDRDHDHLLIDGIAGVAPGAGGKIDRARGALRQEFDVRLQGHVHLSASRSLHVIRAMPVDAGTAKA